MNTTTPLHYPATHLHRLDDPTTSIEAAGDANGVRVSHRYRVLTVFAQHRGGLDYVSAANAAGLERHEAQRRISDLQRLGLLTVKLDDDGRPVRVRLDSGRSGRVHVITPAGLTALEIGFITVW